jgi:hypothetical protein
MLGGQDGHGVWPERMAADRGGRRRFSPGRSRGCQLRPRGLAGVIGRIHCRYAFPLAVLQAFA